MNVTKVWINVNKKKSKNYNSFGYDLGMEVTVTDGDNVQVMIDKLTADLEKEVDSRIERMIKGR